MDFEVYPRVKVREQEQNDNAFSPPKENNGALSLLKIIESLSQVQEKENQRKSPAALIARSITKPNNVPSLTTTTTTPVSANSKVNNSSKTPILRPRAVLSSPANDGIIGSRRGSKVNSIERERSLALRKYCDSEPKKPTQIKAIACHEAKAEKPASKSNIRSNVRTKKKGPSSSSSARNILEEKKTALQSN